ncbi:MULTISPECIES: hydrogenase large subunit [Lacrimispora]|jgi:ech hydrogenase subunit E|uniref:Ech hydrogenase subunit E n=1 Tax=Lacrimispora sphenoides JCM 1415 TaxID=1297793 RepID=A0ABY1C9X9_9FIRM|nr:MULTISPECIES: nickel-dependent hydrogenase large subunit [Lacrimispora]EXG87514.1 ech hydrogenase subunit E [Clostridium sp. ASBs410]MDR7811105.1 nickel-dependent hydrogenase large subunit [Lacrimispora sp.]SET83506.1 ech hydrogenase subunit E [[Clostridium] sphenoides JCM 1415]SUY51639.1 NADH-ubiquinone oxidoreductase chain 49kDa [Lacrimispora sphenoides]
MGNRTIVPFGPQHPVLPEPIHLDLVLEDERVIEAIPRIGYIHRGLEKLVEKKDYQQYVYVAERICGICSFMHGMGYCMSIESIMEVEIPERAKFLRTIWAELSRLHSHLLWLGLLADAFGFESLFMHSWKLREQVLDIFEETTGGRVIFSVCDVGGVKKDISSETLNKMKEVLTGMEKELKEAAAVFLNDSTVKLRTKGVGVLSKEAAFELGAVGPMARASGIEMDIRSQGYAAYGQLDFKPITDQGGDCYARTKVRIGELFQSIDLIRQCIAIIPDGEVKRKVTGNPKGEHFTRLEQPRGEVLYYTKANGTKFLDRVRVRTPTFANVPALLETLKNCSLADVPILILTIDPCISCTER